ncbi:MAG: hypothetical protein Q8N59_03675, partial [bacterium]|nr:hypothetical protein [bacterium]
IEAYRKLFSKEPKQGVELWRLAKKVLSNWDVPKIGEELAIETLFEIINRTEFPDVETTHEIVGRAENKITEFLPELSEHDPHMDVIAYLENKYWEKKNEKTKDHNPENKII